MATAKKGSVPFTKDQKVLCIVESPNKKSTISSIFKSCGYPNVTVMASVGHFREIKNAEDSYWNTGIYPDRDFAVNYSITPDKKDIVKDLKAAVAKAEVVLLATDPDREGECIAWHLFDQLKIPAKKCKRITFHEITKAAVMASLEEARDIDMRLVDAAKSRSIVDKMIGFRMSPIARKVLGAKSVGRCQSAGLMILANREREIKEFVPETYYDLYLDFRKGETDFRAKYIGTEEKPVKNLPDKASCDAVIEACDHDDYRVHSIANKEIKESPKPPFTTSTFQQEANRVYGMPIDMAMGFAQKLFEGLNVDGEHIGLITYIRTDDDTMSPEFADVLREYVVKLFGKDHLGSVKASPKSDEAQCGHECLRVINPTMTPAKLAKYVSDPGMLKVYKLIWIRTVTSMMAPAVIGDTQYTIANGEHLFALHSRELIFDGYRAAKAAVSDDDTEVEKDTPVKETFEVGELIDETALTPEEKQTQPPKRYTQATFVHELEKQGVGRPSTFASIVKTILSEDRGYCETEGKSMVPTDRGMVLIDFLENHFDNIINVPYTRVMEKSLDAIAKGELTFLEFLAPFHKNLEETVEKSGCDDMKPSAPVYGPTCPICGMPMRKRSGPYGPFWGCTGYPKCKGVIKIFEHGSHPGKKKEWGTKAGGKK